MDKGKITRGGGKRALKESVGALVLGCFLSGSAFADTINNPVDKTITSDINVESGESFSNAGTIQNNNITVDGSSFSNTGTIDTSILEIKTNNGGSIILSGNISAKESITYRGRGDNNYTQNLNAVLNTPLLNIIGQNIEQTGLKVSSQESIQNVKDFYIESNGGKTGLIVNNNTQLDINGNVTLVNTVSDTDKNKNSEDARIEVYDKGTINIANLIVKQNKGLLQTNDNSSISVKNIIVESGRLTLQTLGDQNNYGTFNLNNIFLKEGTKIQAGPYGATDGTVGTQSMPMTITGNIIVDLAKDAGVDFGGFKDWGNQDWRPESITFAADSLTVNVADSRSDSFVYLSGYEDENGKKLKTKVENIKLIATANNNTGEAEADLTALANIIKTNTKEGAERENTLRCLPGVQLEQKPTDIFDGSTAIIADSGDCKDCTIENVKTEKVQTQENPNINGIAEMAALGLHVWRNEIDEMHRRVGELRDSSESIDGVWARVNNGQARYGNQDVKNNYTSVQAGYDRQVSPGVWVGGALSYTDGDNDFRYGDGETDLYAFSLYNSWLFDNGIYLDLVGKIGRMKNSFDIQYDSVDSSGDYHTNAVSLSAELGWRYYATESLFVEPQAEMWYGHVFDADYHTSTGIDVDNKAVDSLVGRLGLKLGFDFPDELGSFFVKASVLHDWEGDADFTFRKGDIERSLTESLGGTWYEYGFGADFNPTDKVHLYADVEAGNGGEVDTDYRFNLGARYAF